jgi:hypothetical protein
MLKISVNIIELFLVYFFNKKLANQEPIKPPKGIIQVAIPSNPA